MGQKELVASDTRRMLFVSNAPCNLLTDWPSETYARNSLRVVLVPMLRSFEQGPIRESGALLKLAKMTR